MLYRALLSERPLPTALRASAPELTPLSGPLGIQVATPTLDAGNTLSQAKELSCHDSLVILHQGTHSYVLLAILQ